MSNGEPWDFFKAIEDLQDTVKGLEATKARAQDTRLIAIMAFLMAFMAFYFRTPRIARQGKDSITSTLKAWGLSSRALNTLEIILRGACDELEKQARR